MLPERTRTTASLTERLLYGFIFLPALVIGLTGLVLPVIPGILFLVIAAFAGARLSPRLGAWLAGHRLTGPWMHNTARFSRLPLTDKFKCGGLLMVKLVLEALALIESLARKLVAKLSAGLHKDQFK